MVTDRMLQLSAGKAEAILVPEMGGGIASLSVDGKPVLRPWSGNAEEGPFALASNVLVPFSNRIQDGFTFRGAHHEMRPNLDGEAFAIHGDGFQKIWAVAGASNDAARLVLNNGAFGPYRYEAAQTIKLDGQSLAIELTMTNRADMALPFGGGFHPWFPRSGETRLIARLDGHWPQTADYLPSTEEPQTPPDDFVWNDAAPLPDRFINGCFSGWSGHAFVHQGDDAVSVAIKSPTLTTAIIYSPAPDCGFFCFEPVSHPVNAHNLPGLTGLEVLEPGQSLSMEMVLDWSGA